MHERGRLIMHCMRASKRKVVLIVVDLYEDLFLILDIWRCMFGLRKIAKMIDKRTGRC
jgi:hypothetical protein